VVVVGVIVRVPGDVLYPWLERKMRTACTQLASDSGKLAPCY
jgi:hypothetical protein